MLQCLTASVPPGVKGCGVQCRGLASFLNFSVQADLRSYVRSQRHASTLHKVRDLLIAFTVIQTVLIFTFLAWRFLKNMEISAWTFLVKIFLGTRQSFTVLRRCCTPVQWNITPDRSE